MALAYKRQNAAPIRCATLRRGFQGEEGGEVSHTVQRNLNPILAARRRHVGGDERYGRQMGKKSMSKAIVVLSDGTGNSAAKLAKTNVWRMYKALDLTEPADPGISRQIAFYDDGVGTSSFRPLALLGGIFGWGLKNNVLDLYKFICWNYEDGDRIYAFGFSRGAFTIRILVGILAREGILHGLTEEELERHAPDAYRSFRKCFDRTKGLVAPLRRLRDKAIGLRQHLTPHCRTYAEIKR